MNIEYLEQQFQKFQKVHEEASYSSFVEYLGINFSESTVVCPVYKAYYTTTQSMKKEIRLLQPLFEQDMIHALNLIDDTVNSGFVRYEIGLGKRTDDNMAFLKQWVKGLYPEIEAHHQEIESFFALKCTQKEGYQYAALYFLGLIAESDSVQKPLIKAVKLHFLLRMCSNPDQIGKSFIVNTSGYLEELSNLGIEQIAELVMFLKVLSETSEFELWMAAVDYYRDGLTKYKLYIKKFSKRIYTGLFERFTALGCMNLAEQLHTYSQWLKFHPELEQYGLAICLDSYGVWSVNFYH